MAIEFTDDVVTLDIESHSVTELGTMPPEEYFRLGQFAFGEGPVHTTTSLLEFRKVLLRARMLIGSNILGFDLRAVFGTAVAGARLAKAGRVFDTHVHAMIAMPPPFGKFTKRDGRDQKCTDPLDYRRWISLDNLAFQMGLEGKLADLTELTEKYANDWEPVLTKTGKPSMSKGQPRMRKEPKPGICCPYGAVPVDDPEFVAYAEQDVTVAREVARGLLERYPFNEYARFKQLEQANAVLIGKENGFTVDAMAARTMVGAQQAEARRVLQWLKDTYDFPIDMSEVPSGF